MSNTRSKIQSPYRFKRAVYTDSEPGLDSMIQRAVDDGRVFTTFACLGIKEWLVKNGYGEKNGKSKPAE